MKKRKKKELIMSVLVIIIFIGTTLMFGQEDYTQEEKRLFQRFKIANKHFENGKAQFFKEDYKKAEKEFMKCLEKMPEHTGAYFFLSQINYNKEKLETAMKQIEKAKENFASMDRIRANLQQLVILELQEQKMAKEERLWELKASLSRGNLTAEQQSQVQARIGSVEADIGVINSQLSNPVPESQEIPADYFYLHGNILFKMKKLQEAYAQYKEAIRINPRHGDAYNNLANLYYMSKQYQKALDCLEQAEANGAIINPGLKKAVLNALGKDQK